MKKSRADFRTVTGGVLAVAAAGVAAFLIYAATYKVDEPQIDSAAAKLSAIPKPLLRGDFFGRRPISRVEYVNTVVADFCRLGRTKESLDQKDIDALAQSAPPARVLAYMRDYLKLDPDKDGTLTKYEVAEMAGVAFDALDFDHDGQIKDKERMRLEGLAKSAAFRAACDIAPPAPDEKLVVVSAGRGRLVSSLSVAGQDRTTTAISLMIAPGKEKIYLAVANDNSVIWLLSGDVKRVSKMVVAGPSGSVGGKIEAGVIGLPAVKISFHDRWTCLPKLGTPATMYTRESATPDLLWLFKRDADVFGGQRELFGMKLEGDALAVVPDEKQKEAPAGFDAQTWKSFLYGYAGVIDLPAAAVVSDAAAAPYLVLPGWAGLSQLVARGQLVSSPPSRQKPEVVASNGIVVSEFFPQRFWITADLPALPADVYGTKFILAKGRKLPEKTPDACVISQETGRALTKGLGCEIESFPIEPAGAAGDCAYKGVPGMKETLRAQFLQARGQGLTGIAREFKGTTGSDSFFVNDKNDTATFTGLGGQDFYYLPLKKGKYTISEQAVAGEANTLIFSDVPMRETPDLSVSRPDSTSLRIKLRTEGGPSITIADWFGEKAKIRKPVACFVFLPDYEMLSANDIEAWGQREALDMPLREFKPGIIKTGEPHLAIKALPQGTAVHYLGVDGSAEGKKPPPGIKGDSYGRVDVRVWPTMGPVFLVLASFDPVHWAIFADPRAKIAGVMLTGFYRQSVESNLQGIPVYNFSAEAIAENYFTGMHENIAAKNRDAILQKITGAPRGTVRFQYQHLGTTFEVK
ncbi:MAG: hypothetical protein ACAH80_14130 [Alphaproteobacteria bacterium]